MARKTLTKIFVALSISPGTSWLDVHVKYTYNQQRKLLFLPASLFSHLNVLQNVGTTTDYKQLTDHAKPFS